MSADHTVIEYRFGKNGNISGSSVYNREKGYGFTDISYPCQAQGWIDNVYHPRAKHETLSAVHVSESDNSLKIRGKAWTETGDALNGDSATKGIFLYDETSVFNVELSPADYDVMIVMENPTDTEMTVNLFAENLLKTSVKVPANSKETSADFTISLVEKTLRLKFEAASTATEETDAETEFVHVKSVRIKRLEMKAPGAKPTVYIASDSTVQTYDAPSYPQKGWGQVLYQYFKGAEKMTEFKTNAGYTHARRYELPQLTIENRSIGGRSSRSFLEEGKLDNLLSSIRPGDYLFVQWGDNDATYIRPNRYVASPDFARYIQKYIDGARQRKAKCVLVTPPPRYDFKNGKCVISFPEYRDVMLDLASKENLPLIDLGKAGSDFLTSFGQRQSKIVFMQLPEGIYENFPAGLCDATHFQQFGARRLARIVAELIEKNGQLQELASLIADIPVPEKAPAVPADFKTLSVGSASVKMVWNKVPGADFYYVYRAVPAESPDAESEPYAASVAAQYNDTECSPETEYAYRVSAHNEKGESPLCEPISVSTKSSLYRYDFAGKGSKLPAASGFIKVKADKMYNAADGYGFTQAPADGGCCEKYGSVPENDFCKGPCRFAVDVPGGDYSVKLYSGDSTGCERTKTTITANGTLLGTADSARGSVIFGVYTARALGGRLELEIGGSAYLNGLEITPLNIAPSGLNAYEVDLTKSADRGYFSLRFNPTQDAVSYRIYHKAAGDKEFSVLDSFSASNGSDLHSYNEKMGETYQFYVAGVMANGEETAPSNTLSISMSR